MDIANTARHIIPFLRRNSSTILTGLGVAGSLGSTILAIKATPQAQSKLEQAYLNKNVDRSWDEAEALTPLEMVKAVWIDYTPALMLQVVTIGCIVGSQSINLRKQAAVISVATGAETMLREYQEHVAAEAPNVDRKVRDTIAAKRVEENPVSKGEVLGRYFQSTMQKIDKAVNDINFRILNQEGASLNEFYSEIGLPQIPPGEDIGWSPESPLEIDKSTHITDDDRAAVVITFIRQPSPNFWKGFR
jgi:hypothetical protein